MRRSLYIDRSVVQILCGQRFQHGQHGSGFSLGGRQIHIAVVAALHLAGTGHGTLKIGHKAVGIHRQLQRLCRGQPSGEQVKAGATAHGANIDHPILHGAVARVGGKQMLQRVGGSSVMSYGSKPDGSAWQVAVTDPRDTEGDYLGVVTLNGTEFLSTSGDYEKYFIEDGVRYHHILDPATGYPARSGLTSVTVVCDDGLNADGLSTACFVLGKEKAEELLKKYNAD